MSAPDQSPTRQSPDIPRARIVPAVGAWLGPLLAALGFGGCQAPFDRYQAELRGYLGRGRYDLIEESLDEPHNEIRDRRSDQLLWMLDRGTVALVLDDTPTTIRVLNEAEELMDQRRRRAFLEDLAAATVSDQLTTYLGEPYEDIYVNVLKMLAHLEAGRLRGGATVEARRLATKVDLLRDEYLQLERRLLASGPSAPGLGTAGYREVATVPGGEFIESSLGTFLTAVTFMHTGDRQNQAVAARRLQQAIKAQSHLLGPVSAEAFGDLGTLEPDDANFLVVALSGQGPHKVAQRVGPIIVHGAPIYFELPVLHGVPSEVAAVRLRLESAALPTTDLRFIEDLGSVAYENHRRQLPLTYARTLARAAAKSIALHQANQAHSQDDAGLAVLVAIAGLLFLAGTEHADLRCWTMLPGQAHVALVKLEPGPHRVVVEFLDARGGVVHRSLPRDLQITNGRLATVVEAYWR